MQGPVCTKRDRLELWSSSRPLHAREWDSMVHLLPTEWQKQPWQFKAINKQELPWLRGGAILETRLMKRIAASMNPGTFQQANDERFRG